MSTKIFMFFASPRATRMPCGEVASCFRLHAKRQEMPPDALYVLDETCVTAGVGAARPRQIVGDDVGNAARARRHHHHAVGSLAAEVTVLIGHDIGPVMNLSDHVIVMHQGQDDCRGYARVGVRRPRRANRLFRTRLTMLEIADLHAHYGASHIVQGVDLAVRAGEVLGVFGRNGVGKTTLLKTIAGWPHHSYEFIEALKVAVETPNAERRWLAGEDIFDKVQREPAGPGTESQLNSFISDAFGV
jgi:energy-coupling factor transporter ATP-binding protein EcfA2